MAAGEGAENLIADLVKPGVQVSFHLSDGSTARARYPFSGEVEPIEGVENLLRLKRRSGQLLAVDSIDDDSGSGGDLYISVQHIVAYRIDAGMDLAEVVG